MKKPILYMMVGIPASGKSTVAKEYASKVENSKVFSSDEYRKSLLGDEQSQENNALVFKTLFTDMHNWLAKGNNAIFDACNTTIKSRRKVVDKFSDIALIVPVVVMATYEECCKRDASRSRTVGISVIRKFINSYEFPQMFEGFHKIKFVQTMPAEYLYNNYYLYYYRKAESFDQFSKWHKYSVGEHCEKVVKQFEDEPMYTAGRYHDYGKMFTQVFGDDGYAHYYSHEHWSTYWFASLLDSSDINDNTLFILFIINNHMKIRDVIKSDKALDKYGKSWGGKRLARLIEFMYADNKASGRVES